MISRNRVAVVMGGGGAIGRSICKVLAKEGIQIVVGDIERENIDLCIKELNQINSTPFIILGDISEKSEVIRMKDEVVNEFGRVDILINVHGSNKNETIFKISEETWTRTLNVHLNGTLNSMMGFASIMKDRKYGRIVNMSSFAAKGSIGGAAYAAAKSGIEGLTRSAALEWAHYNITVNCLAPGIIGGGSMFDRTTPKEFQITGIERSPMKRAGKPEEVAAVAKFLASEEASFVTGQTIYVCGGLSVGIGF